MINVNKLLLILFICGINISAQWTKTNLPSTAFSLAISGDNIFAGTLSGGVYRSVNNGTNWTEINNGLTIKQVWSLAVLGNTVFAGTNNGGLFKSTDNGASWSLSNSGIPSTTIIRAIAQFGTKLFLTTSNSGVYISSDNGATWSQHNSGITGLVARPLLVTDTDLFVGVMQKVYKYDNANSKWTAAGTGIPNNTITSLAQINSNKNLFASISNSGSAVSRSTNNGTNWTVVDNGLPGVPVDAIATVGTNIFAANDYGVYLSADFGANWSDVSTGMTGASYCTFLTPGRTDLFVIYKGDVWKRSYQGMITSAEKSSNEIPSTISLSQNYPNPFNPGTSIKFTLAAAANVKITVYDILGNKINELVNGNKPAGSHVVYWNSSDSRGNKVAGGVYFYRLETENYTQIMKMNLLK